MTLPDAQINLYTSLNGISTAQVVQLIAPLPIDNDYDNIIGYLDDSAGSSNGEINLELVYMPDLRLNWVSSSSLSGGRTHLYTFGERFLDFGGGGNNVGIHGRLEGTATHITHLNVGFNSGGRLKALRAVRGKQIAGVDGKDGVGLNTEIAYTQNGATINKTIMQVFQAAVNQAIADGDLTLPTT